MRAFRIIEPGRTALVDVAVPVPGPGQVLLRVLANGLCHSDLFIRDLPASLPGTSYPVTMGHEIAGEVTETGAGVSGWRPGDRAVSYVLRGCGDCVPCRRHQDNLCRRGYRGIGTHFDGGLAEYVLVGQDYLVGIGDLSPVAAAPLADAGMTAFHAVDRALHVLGPQATAVVMGVGGLGHLAVQLLKALSAATVIALDTDRDRLDLALEMGADHAVASEADAAQRIRQITGVEGVAVTLDFVGVDATLLLAGEVTTGGGVIVVPGQGNGSVPFTASVNPVIHREVSILQTQAGSLEDLRSVVALARRGIIVPRVSEYPLEQTDQALLDLDERRVLGRAVVIP